MKKIILIILALLLLIGGVYLGYTLIKEKDLEGQVLDPFDVYMTEEEIKTGLSNPASVYCADNGGTLEIKEEKEGQVGYCLFEDGSSCEEGAYYRGECKKGENK